MCKKIAILAKCARKLKQNLRKTLRVMVLDRELGNNCKKGSGYCFKASNPARCTPDR
jgi:hypothetical protein